MSEYTTSCVSAVLNWYPPVASTRVRNERTTRRSRPSSSSFSERTRAAGSSASRMANTSANTETAMLDPMAAATLRRRRWDGWSLSIRDVMTPRSAVGSETPSMSRESDSESTTTISDPSSLRARTPDSSRAVPSSCAKNGFPPHLSTTSSETAGGRVLTPRREATSLEMAFCESAWSSTTWTDSSAVRSAYSAETESPGGVVETKAPSLREVSDMMDTRRAREEGSKCW